MKSLKKVLRYFWLGAAVVFLGSCSVFAQRPKKATKQPQTMSIDSISLAWYTEGEKIGWLYDSRLYRLFGNLRELPSPGWRPPHPESPKYKLGTPEQRSSALRTDWMPGLLRGLEKRYRHFELIGSEDGIRQEIQVPENLLDLLKIKDIGKDSKVVVRTVIFRSKFDLKARIEAIAGGKFRSYANFRRPQESDDVTRLETRPYKVHDFLASPLNENHLPAGTCVAEIIFFVESKDGTTFPFDGVTLPLQCP